MVRQRPARRGSPDLRGANRNVLITVLTARTDGIDIVVGLDAGVDDYPGQVPPASTELG